MPVQNRVLIITKRHLITMIIMMTNMRFVYVVLITLATITVITTIIIQTPISTIRILTTTEPAFTMVTNFGVQVITPIIIVRVPIGIGIMVGVGEPDMVVDGEIVGELITIHGILGDIVPTIHITDMDIIHTTDMVTMDMDTTATAIMGTTIITTTVLTTTVIITDQELHLVRATVA